MSKVTICDSTLRDGSHAVRHQVSLSQVRAVCRALSLTGVPVVEVSHGDGLGGSSLTYGRSSVSDIELIAVAVEELPRARVAVLLIPGIGVMDDLREAHDAGASVARIATHCTEADVSWQHIALARELGMTTVGFLMMAHMTPAAALAREASIMADAGAEVVYVTDSAGALLPREFGERVTALRQALPPDVQVGVHAHQNLSLAIANTAAAVDAGATWADGCLCGLGAGAGNAPIEVLAAVLERLGHVTEIDVDALIDVAEDVVRPMVPRVPTVDRSSLILGLSGVYSSFLLHAERAAKRFSVPTAAILREAGRRRSVGGQEDLLIEIAAGLANRAEQSPQRGQQQAFSSSGPTVEPVASW